MELEKRPSKGKAAETVRHLLAGRSGVLYAAQLMWDWEATAPQGFMKMIAPSLLFFFFYIFFPCKIAVHNDHLSILSVGTKSRCAVARYRGLKGGNSYLTCTAERQRLTERCHFQRKRSAPNCKRNVARQGQGVTKTCVWDDPGPQVGAPV